MLSFFRSIIVTFHCILTECKKFKNFYKHLLWKNYFQLKRENRRIFRLLRTLTNSNTSLNFSTIITSFERSVRINRTGDKNRRSGEAKRARGVRKSGKEVSEWQRAHLPRFHVAQDSNHACLLPRFPSYFSPLSSSSSLERNSFRPFRTHQPSFRHAPSSSLPLPLSP